MRFSGELLRGTLLKRVNRFIIDVRLDAECFQKLPIGMKISEGNVVSAHCANTGVMNRLKDPGNSVLVSISENKARRNPLTWELVQVDGVWVGTNTSHPPVILKEALENKLVSELREFTTIQTEVNYGERSRIDLLLSKATEKCFIEVKNVHMKVGDDVVAFPDAPTQRGVKHLAELANEVKRGHRAAIVFVAQRSDCTKFRVASEIDPKFLEALNRARKEGVEAYAFSCMTSPSEITLHKRLEIQ
eukprot:TRINITY_DN9469_c0_g1_i4.p1 TRINITY_DN9469_c0_g1~~TRINITY_DN9469_c0_g1_i4.p1  ORF type:complete len:246 (-),score=13.39 TRINITY_DN9469_c0_g1_i4:221-958(-)